MDRTQGRRKGMDMRALARHGQRGGSRRTGEARRRAAGAQAPRRGGDVLDRLVEEATDPVNIAVGIVGGAILADVVDDIFD